MKTKDILIIGGLLIGGYFLYKMLNGGSTGIAGGGGGGSTPALEWDIPELPQFELPEITTGTSNTTQKPTYFLEYGSTPAPLSKRISVPATTWKYNKKLIVPYIPKDWTPAFKQSIRALFPPAIIQ